MSVDSAEATAPAIVMMTAPGPVGRPRTTSATRNGVSITWTSRATMKKSAGSSRRWKKSEPDRAARVVSASACRVTRP